MTRLSNAVCLALALAMAPGVAHAGNPTGQEIMQKVEDRDQGKDATAKVSLEIKPKQGKPRLRQFVFMRKKDDDMTKLVAFILAPTDVRGSAFMAYDRKNSDDLRWLYLPSIGQVRQLSAESTRQSFFGSDFVYEDFTNRDPDLDEHKLIGSQKVDQWDCWLVESTPKSTRGVDFAKYRTWVWKKGDLPVRQEFYDGDGKVVRRGQIQSIKEVQGIQTWHQGTMENLRTGSSSKIQFDDVKYNTGVPDERFSDSQLSRGAPK